MDNVVDHLSEFMLQFPGGRQAAIRGLHEKIRISQSQDEKNALLAEIKRLQAMQQIGIPAHLNTRFSKAMIPDIEDEEIDPFEMGIEIEEEIE